LRRGQVTRAVPEGTVAHAGRRVAITRPGITEWFENSSRGLEQGFTIQERLRGEGPLVLELALGGATARLSGTSIELTTEAGRTLDYSKLVAEDSAGRLLASRLDVPSPDRVHLVVEDGEARYPLLIDPLLTGQPDQRLESNQSDPEGHGTPEFGFSVASAGDVNRDGFDDVIVGAPGWDGGQQGEGAAFVFLGSAGGIQGSDPATAQAHLESNQPLAAFGVSVSGAGDVNGDGYDDVIVGANFYDSVLPGTQLAVTGAAFVFLGGPSGIQGRDPATAHATVFANKYESEFGEVVARAGDVNRDGFADVLVCAPHQGHDFPPESGIPPNQQSGEHGVAFVFHGSAAGVRSGTGSVVADAVLLPYEPGPVDPVILAQFSRVDGAGDVNADGFDDVLVGGNDTYLFIGSPGGVVGRDPTEARSRIRGDAQTSLLNVSGAGDVNGDGFDDVLIGAPGRESEPFTQDQHGAAYVFLGGAAGIVGSQVADAHAAFFGSILAEWLGYSVDTAGDVDRDGFADIVVAARVYPGSLANEGVAYLFRGSAQGITAQSLLDADVRIEARQSGAVVNGTTAFSVAGAGDVNGDGFSDVIMGKGFFDAGQVDEGAAFIYLGGPWPPAGNQPPIARAGDDQVVYDLDANGSQSITVDGRASFDPDGTIAAYAWYEGETLLGTSAVLTTSLSTTGDHTLVLTVTDNAGATGSDPVTVRVDQVQSTRVFSESFASGFGAWSRGGDVVLSSADSFPTAPQARLGASGAFLRRTISLPSGSTGVALDFWAKARQFAAGDELLVKVSVNGGPFATARRFTSADSTNSYVFYGGSAIPLGYSWHPATATSMVLEFESRMTTGQFFVDDIRVDALIAPAGAGGGGSNQPPAAHAGPDRTVADSDGNGTEAVTLDGSASTDPDGTIASYEWREGITLLGQGATLNRAFAVGAHTVTLVATDDDGASASDAVTITVEPRAAPNQPPVANAGPDQAITDADLNGTEVVTFDGRGSSDPDGTIVSYIWRKNGNMFNNAATFSVTQPLGTHTIELTVTDDKGATSTDTVVVTIGTPPPPPTNQPPVANAGPDQTVTAAANGIASVLLDGTASFDPDGQVSGYGWYENGVQIASAFGVGVPLTVGVHTITLRVTDNVGAVDTDDVVITVNPPAEGPAEPEGTVTITGPSSIERGDRESFTVRLTNTSSITLQDVTISFSVSPRNRLRSISPSSPVEVGNMAPGATVTVTWSARGDDRGSGTITVAASTGGQTFATATKGITVTR
jgi:hypothetical protein